MIPLIFVSGPLMTGNEPEQNVLRACNIANHILESGGLAFIPHLFWHMNKNNPHPEAWWVQRDLEYMGMCNALYVFDINSNGGRREVAHAQNAGLPIFYELDVLKKWIRRKLL